MQVQQRDFREAEVGMRQREEGRSKREGGGGTCTSHRCFGGGQFSGARLSGGLAVCAGALFRFFLRLGGSRFDQPCSTPTSRRRGSATGVSRAGQMARRTWRLGPPSRRRVEPAGCLAVQRTIRPALSDLTHILSPQLRGAALPTEELPDGGASGYSDSRLG